MDKNDEQPAPFSDIQSSAQRGPVNADKAFSESVGSLSAGEPATDVAMPPDNQPLTEQPAEAAPKVPAHKPKAPVVAIILAVLVAGSLAVVSVFAYRQANKPATTPSSDTPEAVVSDSDIDAVITDAEQSINELNEGDDFSESELSDSALGL